jgi:predicted component of type VI protein secretion system
VLGYGVPDPAATAPADEAGLAALERALERAIAAFEPRLARPAVRLERRPGEPQLLHARITGGLAPGAADLALVLPLGAPPRAADG